MVKLSRRLSAVASLVTDGSVIADIGTDHGYLPIYLCESGRIPSALAFDIGSGPLERAVSHIREAGLEDRIITRQSDGLCALNPGEASCILISGMGGPLTCSILGNGLKKLESVDELVLQPQSEIFCVRKWLAGNGFAIIAEDIVFEDGKYYPMFKAVHGDCGAYTEADFCYGRADISRSPDVLESYLNFRLSVLNDILSNAAKGESGKSQSRAFEVRKEIMTAESKLEEARLILKS